MLKFQTSRESSGMAYIIIKIHLSCQRQRYWGKMKVVQQRFVLITMKLAGPLCRAPRDTELRVKSHKPREKLPFASSSTTIQWLLPYNSNPFRFQH